MVVEILAAKVVVAMVTAGSDGESDGGRRQLRIGAEDWFRLVRERDFMS